MQKKIINLDDLLIQYFNQILPNERSKLLTLSIFLLRIIHIIGIFFLIFGCVLPKKFRDYHIIWCLKTLFLWYLLDGKCYLTMFINLFKDKKEYEPFLPTSSFASNLVVFTSLTVSIFSLLLPEYSAFNLIKNMIINLEKLN